MTLKFVPDIPRPGNPTSHATPHTGRHESLKAHGRKADR
jgi:hypothetical protein